MSEDWPNLESLALRVNDLVLTRAYSIEDMGIVLTLVWCIASQTVHTYSEPVSDPSLPDDDKQLARHCGSTRMRVARARPAIDRLFVSRDGLLRLRDPSIVVHLKPGRSPLPARIRTSIYNRDGGKCIYCGDTDGPFHVDHVFPFSRGGSDDPANLALACATCNLSKSDMTIAEWMASK